MSRRNDFTAEQWRALRNAPQLVALATAAAGHSGLFGSLAEGMAAASAFAAAGRGNNLLIKELFSKQAIGEAQQDIRSLLESFTDPAEAQGRLQDAAIHATRTALAALQSKDDAVNLSDFRKMLVWLAEEIANASKEGDFLGFGGERVSEGERRFLARLSAAIGQPTQ
jgi:hypothetical protein